MENWFGARRRRGRALVLPDGRLEGCPARKAEELGLVGGALGDGLCEVKPDWPERRSPDDRAARGCADCAPVAADPNAIALREV
jgi:hypothetical protein